MTDAPNPERRSDAAMWCLAIGLALMAASWFLGVGAVMATAYSGGDPLAIAGGVFGFVLVIFTLLGGGLLALIGMIWIIVLVIADARGEDKDRYKNVER